MTKLEEKLKIILEEDGLQWKYDFTELLLSHLKQAIITWGLDCVGEDVELAGMEALNKTIKNEIDPIREYIKNEAKEEIRQRIRESLGEKE